MCGEELINMHEVARLSYRTVVVAIWEFLPRDGVGSTKPEELLHMRWPVILSTQDKIEESTPMKTHGTISSFNPLRKSMGTSVI